MKKLTREQEEQFLQLLADGYGRMAAAHEIGLEPEAVIVYARENSAFEAKCQEAEELAHEQVRAALYAAATSGNVTAIQVWERMYRGRQTVRVCSDSGASEVVAQYGPNRLALEQTLAELEKQERLSKVDAARVQAARSLADAVDKDNTNAYLWRTYREALDAILNDRDEEDEDFKKLIAEINSAAALGDTTQT